MLNHHRLHCYSLTLVLARTVPALLATWPRGSSDLQDQLKRALSSVLLNIAEGNGRTSPADRKRFFTIARGSATEVGAIFDFASAMQWGDAAYYVDAQSRVERIVQMVSKLR